MAEYIVSSGVTSTGIALIYDSMYVQSGGTANSNTVNRMGWLCVSGGGVANSTAVNNAGSMAISSGGVANSTTVNSDGRMHVSGGGSANNTIVNSCGYLIVSGGVANSTTVNTMGSMYISSGGTATIAFNPWQGDNVTSETGAVVTYLERDANVYVGCASGFIRKGDDFAELTVGEGTSALVYSGGVIDDCRLQNGGTMEIYSGATVNGFTLKHDSSVSNTLTLDDITVSGRAQITDNLRVSDVEITSGGRVMVGEFASGSEFSVTKGASLFVLGGGIAEDITVTGGGVYVATGGEITGNIEVTSGGLYLYGGSIVDGDIHVKGLLYVDDTMVNNGHITVELNPASAATAMIENLDLMTNTSCFSVETASAGNGTYTLASGATDFDGTITVEQNGASLGSLAIGETQEWGGINYTLTKNDDALSFIVGAVIALPAKGDLDGNGLADVIMTIDQSTHPADGSTGAWLIQDDQTAKWGDLSQRNNGWSILGAGWTSVKTTADIYVKSADNVIGAWITDSSGKVTGWETVGSFSADTQVLGLGDFNADGKSDLLLRNTNGAVGCHLTDGTGWNYFQSLGNEWKICGIGDLNGDGRDDVVLKHNAGFAGSWLTQADGTMAWADLDTLQSGFEIVGCGDFNGDGTDDVLLKNGNYYGAWIVKDGNAASWLGLGTLDATVEDIADFNGDGVDDLRVRTDAGDLGAELVMGEDTLLWNYYGSVGDEWKTKLASL